MKRYQLFREFNDASVWGDNLADALKRKGSLTTEHRVENYQRVPGKTLTFKQVLGYRDRLITTRGQWPVETAVVELDDGRVIEVDAREDGSLVAS